jgi:hypothetical protein
MFTGVKGRDWVLAGVLTALGATLALLNITASDSGTARDVAAGEMVHTIDSHSPWQLLFAVAFVPVLWWRRSALVATLVSLGVVTLHDLLFGWVTRCGAGLPLAFVLAFLGALSYGRTKAWVSCALSALLTGAVLAVDASAGPGALILALPVVVIVFGLGRAVRHRALLNRRLTARDEELRQLRDEPEQARALLESIESGSRQTMDDMRDIVGLLRGGEVALAPVPTVAHLDALLARHRSAQSRLTVSGDPRSLPATVELSAYRIVEYLMAALDERPVRVTVRFADETLEILVEGSVARGPEVRAAVARVRERAKLHAGSVDVKLARGSARVLAQLPVLG